MNPQKLEEKIAHLRERLLFFLYPPKCAACGAMGYKTLCPDCQKKLEDAFSPRKFIPNGGNGYADGMFTLFPYEEYTVQKLLFDWKLVEYRDLPEIFTPFLDRFCRKKLLPRHIHCISFLPRRRWARLKTGFDQAQCVTAIFARLSSLPFPSLLIRQGFARAQHKSSYKKRVANIYGAFRSETKLKGETVLLIDDIVTTGATAREGARILKNAGAMKVYILSIAH